MKDDGLFNSKLNNSKIIKFIPFFFLAAPSACRILVPQPGKPWPSALGMWSLKYWTVREVLKVILKDNLCTDLRLQI